MLKRKFYYLITLLLILIVNILYSEYEPFLFLVLMIVFPIVLLIILYVQNYYLELNISIKDQVVGQDEFIEVITTLDNLIFMPIPNIQVKAKFKYLNYDFEESYVFHFEVPGAKKVNISNKVKMNYCGIVEVSFEQIKLYDYISLFKSKIKHNFQFTLSVMPRLHLQTHEKPRVNHIDVLDSSEYSKEIPGNDPSEIFDLREYAYGDSLNKVHWKLSSKCEDLIIKEYSLPIDEEQVILLELLLPNSNQNVKNLDAVYEVMYSLGNYMCNNQIIYKLVYYDIIATKLNVINVDNVKVLQNTVKDIIQMKVYDKPYAWNSFCMSGFTDNSKVHYIRCVEYKDETYLNADHKNNRSNIFLVDDSNVQEIVDKFYKMV